MSALPGCVAYGFNDIRVISTEEAWPQEGVEAFQERWGSLCHRVHSLGQGPPAPLHSAV